MRQPAADRAGGRRAARPHRAARACRRLVVGGLVLGTAVTGTGTAVGAATGHPAAVRAPAPATDDTSDPDRPLDIEISRLEPRTVSDGSTLTVAGTLVNTGDTALDDLSVRLQRGEVFTTRAQLLAADADPDPASLVVGAFASVPGQLAPGESLPFSYEVPAAALQLDAAGVYPALLNVNATDEQDQRRRVGELATYLVRPPAAPAVATEVAWLWPIVADTARRPGGDFADDDLATAVAPGGRLDRALAVLERLPRTAPEAGPAQGDGQPAPVLPVTMAVDPALVEELAVMAAGPYPVDGAEGAGQGSAAAAAFLQRLRALAAVLPVVALPYGDVDADALTAVGLEDVVLRSLPGTPAGTAEDPAGAAAPEVAPVPAMPEDTGPEDTGPEDTDPSGTAPAPAAGAGPTAPATPDAPAPARPVPPAEDLGTPAGAGARILADALGVRPRTDLAWAAGGAFRPATVATLRAGGITRLVLGSTGVDGGDRVLGVPGGPAAARAELTTPAGPLEVLVADSTLGTLAATAEDRPGGPRLAEQRYLAELALVGQQAPPGGTPTVLVAPPREVDAGPDGAGAMMAATAGLPWLQPASVGSLLASPAAGTVTLADPADASRLDPDGLADVVATEELRDGLAEAVVGEPDEVLQAYDAALARTTSVALRDDPVEFRTAAAELRSSVQRLLRRVTLVTPADGTYSLASSDAPLVLTVQNDLPFAVTVLLDLGTRGRRGIEIDDIGPQRLAPGERTTLQVPTQVRQSGSFAVTAELRTPTGIPLGEPVALQVQSTAYGTVSLLITFGAAALLGLLFLRRLVLFLRRRRVPAGGPGDAPEGASVAVPPVRSPV